MPTMSTVAEQLRQAREVKKLTVEQVAEITKIRTDHVRALEEGNFNVFSAPVYIRGFVRTYSTLLKLNVPEMMAALDGELAQTTKFAEPPPLPGEPRGILDFLTLQFSKVSWRKSMIALGVLLGVVVVVTIYFTVRNHSKADPLKNLKPGLYQSTQHTSGQTLPLPPVQKR